MALKGSYTTADALDWQEMISLVHRLYRDGDYRMSLLIAIQSMWGLRIGDVLKLRWYQILNVEELNLIEEKTGKRRIIKMNPNLQKHIQDCYNALNSPDSSQHVFMSRQNTVYSREWVNMRLKTYKVKYHLHIKNYSTHSHRKAFGKHFLETGGANAERRMILLNSIYNHSTLEVTRRYLGIKQSEIGDVYTSLDF